MERTLLLVDDEPNIITSLKRLLRRDGYRIFSAQSGAEGLSVLAQHPEIGVIMSDQRMPEMLGAAFLSRVKELYPHTVRIVLSGYTELASVTDAINRGAIYKFLTKPWEDDLLRANVKEAYAYFELAALNEQLSRELKSANAALLTVNHQLEQSVETKTDQITRNLDVMQVSQEILERLPIVVIGVGDEGIIAIANQLARELFGENGELLGALASTHLPPDLSTCLLAQVEMSQAGGVVCQLPNGIEAHYWCYSMGRYSRSKGKLLVIVPWQAAHRGRQRTQLLYESYNK